MALKFTGLKRGGGGGGGGYEIEDSQELPGSRPKIPRKLPTFGSGACWYRASLCALAPFATRFTPAQLHVLKLVSCGTVRWCSLGKAVIKPQALDPIHSSSARHVPLEPSCGGFRDAQKPARWGELQKGRKFLLCALRNFLFKKKKLPRLICWVGARVYGTIHGLYAERVPTGPCRCVCFGIEITTCCDIESYTGCITMGVLYSIRNIYQFLGTYTNSCNVY